MINMYYDTMTTFDAPGKIKKPSENIMGKGENAGNHNIVW